MDSRRYGGCVLTALMSFLVALVGAVHARAEDAETAEPTFEQRLLLYNITDGILRGTQPEAGDYATLAKDKGVKRIVCLLAEEEVASDLRDAARVAGIAYSFRPIELGRSDESKERRIDRVAVKAIVESLRKPGDGVTYLHCDNGRDRTGVVHFAYRILVDNRDYAVAMLEVASRGFEASALLGYQEDMKLLALGRDELPVLKILPISDGNLKGRGKRFAVPGVRLNVKMLGSGPALYAIHGGPGETHMILRPYLDALSENHTLVYYDQRGSGLSSRPQFSEAYTIDRLVEDLEQLRIALAHEKISLIAQSSGGAVAVRYALAHRDRVDKLIIVSSWASADEFNPTAVLGLVLMPREDQEALNDVIKKLRSERRDFNDDELAEMQKSFLSVQFFGRVTPEFREDWERRSSLSALAYNALAHEYFGKADEAGRLDLRPQLAALAGVPTLVISGKFDVVTPPSIVKTFADGIPGARFEVFEQSGHYPFVEEHERFIKLVQEFLAQK